MQAVPGRLRVWSPWFQPWHITEEFQGGPIMRMWAYVYITTVLLTLSCVFLSPGDFCLNADSELVGLYNLNEFPGNSKAAEEQGSRGLILISVSLFCYLRRGDVLYTLRSEDGVRIA